VNGKGGYEGEKHFGEGDFWILGEGALFSY
jgi:hypothetical protein